MAASGRTTVPEIVVDPFPQPDALARFWRKAWDSEPHASYDQVLQRSLVHLGAFHGEDLVGFVNVAWDGGIHAFILDTAVDPAYRRQGLARAMVNQATELARERGAHWLHVDFEPHLLPFYRSCGLRATEAGLIRLR